MAGYASEAAGKAALKECAENPAAEPWFNRADLPGYLVSLDGRLAREIKVRTNKNGTRFARVMRGGKQTVIRL